MINNTLKATYYVKYDSTKTTMLRMSIMITLALTIANDPNIECKKFY
jgi:hypothetical protein